MISRYDPANYLEAKLADFFAAGVTCVWFVFPTIKMVRVFRSHLDMQGYVGSDIMDAGPDFAKFKMTVNQMFAKP